ncbi:hypothetical protein EBU99_06345 [bacterium]|nr:hypothetical protein [bacterium]
MNPGSNSWEFEKIEETLRERFLDKEPESQHFIVRYIGSTGDVGRRCLTFNIEVRENEFHVEKRYLEQFVDDLREQGWDIDELRQPLNPGDAFDARLWLIIYERHHTTNFSAETSR